ncbi:MAG: hypothetical protein ABI635_11805 [Actinomycetota bacterium]
MWVLTTDDRRAIYNLSAFEVVVAIKDLGTNTWVVRASDRDGERSVMLAETDDQEAADNIVRMLAEKMGATDLGQQ